MLWLLAFSSLFYLVRPNVAVYYAKTLSLPPWSVGIACQLVAIIAIFYSLRKQEKPILTPTIFKWDRWAVIGLVLGCAAIVFSHHLLVEKIATLPIASKYADMLPLMLEGFKDIENLTSPYRTHHVPWKLENYFLPTTFLPYFLTYKLGLDIRLTTVFCLDLLSLVFLVLALHQRTLIALVSWGLFHLLFTSFALEFVAIIQLGPFWLYVGLLVYFMMNRHWRLALVACILILGARETGLMIVTYPILLLAQHLGWKKTLAYLITGLTTIYGVFLIDNPLFIKGNISGYSALGFYLKDNLDRFAGLSGMLFTYDLMSLRWPIFAGFYLTSLIHFSIQKNQAAQKTLCYSFFGTITFSIWALITWEYLLAPSLILFGGWLIAKRHPPYKSWLTTHQIVTLVRKLNLPKEIIRGRSSKS